MFRCHMAASPQLEFSESDVAESGEEAEVPQTPQRKNKRKEAPDSDQKLPKAKASPKRKSGAVKVGNQRHKPSNKKGTKQCKSCGKTLDHSCFALNQLNCQKCKKAIDVLYKKAKAQNKKDWFLETKQSPTKLRALLNAYFAALDEAKKLGKTKATFCLVQYTETVAAESATRSIDKGRMMWEDQAIGYWMSFEGGYSKKMAQDKWEEMKEDMKTDDTVISDQKGPKHSRLRLRVHTDDEVNFEDAYIRRKYLGSCRWVYVGL